MITRFCPERPRLHIDGGLVVNIEAAHKFVDDQWLRYRWFIDLRLLCDVSDSSAQDETADTCRAYLFGRGHLLGLLLRIQHDMFIDVDGLNPRQAGQDAQDLFLSRSWDLRVEQVLAHGRRSG